MTNIPEAPASATQFPPIEELNRQYGLGAQAATPTHPQPSEAGQFPPIEEVNKHFGIGASSDQGAQPTTAQVASEKTYGKQGVASDIAMSILDALPKGAAQLFGAPGDLIKLGQSISRYVAGKLGISDEEFDRRLQAAEKHAPADIFPTSSDIRGTIEKAAGQPLYEPQTPAGRYAGAAAQGAASMPFGPVAGITSGVGGEVGSNFGPVGRVVGSAAGAMAPGALRAVATSPEKAIAGSNDIAARDVLNQVGPASAAPTEIAPRVQAAAAKSIDQIRQDINTATEKLYGHSRDELIAPQDMAKAFDDPRFQVALKEVRSDPEISPTIADLPDNSVGVLDAVKKRLDAKVQAAKGATPDASDLQKAGLRAQAAESTRTAAATSASGDYAEALATQAARRQGELAPAERSPLGQLAISDDLKKQGSILFAENPAPGSEKQVADAVRAISAKDPEAAQMLVRSKLEQTFNEVTQQVLTGANQKGGAQFAAKIAGNSQQAKNLKAALEALPNGQDASRAFGALLKIFQAQGKEWVPSVVSQLIGEKGPLGTATRVLASPLTNLKANVTYSSNISRLASIMTDPSAIKQVRRLAGIDPKSEAAKTLFATLLASNRADQGTEKNDHQ